MVALPASTGTQRAASWGSRLASFRTWFADTAEIFGAAVRVSRDLDSRRNARPEDLAILGIREPLPRRW